MSPLQNLIMKETSLKTTVQSAGRPFHFYLQEIGASPKVNVNFGITHTGAVDLPRNETSKILVGIIFKLCALIEYFRIWLGIMCWLSHYIDLSFPVLYTFYFYQVVISDKQRVYASFISLCTLFDTVDLVLKKQKNFEF